MKDGDKATGKLTASALTDGGSLYFSGALTPYDVENLCDQIVMMSGRDISDVRVEVDLNGTMPNSPEMQALALRMKRLRKRGLSIRLHTARRRRPMRGFTRG